MHLHLAPGESLLPGTHEAAQRLLDDPDVDAVLLRLVPSGTGRLARSARPYLAEWDRRFVHRMNFYAPASRVASRQPWPGHLAADAAPHLARAIDAGRRVEAVLDGGVATPIATNLQTWLEWASAEGAQWGRLAAREPRFAPFLPALSRRGWMRHNVFHASRRAGEVLEGVRRVDPTMLLLHATREATWTGSAGHAYRQERSRTRTNVF